jgi:hypothetical protein
MKTQINTKRHLEAQSPVRETKKLVNTCCIVGRWKWRWVGCLGSPEVKSLTQNCGTGDQIDSLRTDRKRERGRKKKNNEVLIEGLFVFVLLLYWGYIVRFTKVLKFTPSIFSFIPPPPIPGIVST